MNRFHFAAVSVSVAVVVLLIIGMFLPSATVKVEATPGYLGVSVGTTPSTIIPITEDTPIRAIPYEPGEEIIELRGETSKTYYTENYTYQLIAYGSPIHYKDDLDNPDELWKDVDTSIVESPKADWDWEVVKGNWHLLIRNDTTVAIGKDGNWIGFRYGGFGYLDWGTKDYEILQTRRDIVPVVEGNTITWDGIFGAGTSLEYIYNSEGFKENLYIEQSARDWLRIHPPSSYGLNNDSSYLVGYLECDWRSSYPAETEDGTSINWDNVNEFITSGVYWRDTVKDRIVYALPIGYARHGEVSAEDWVDIRYRFYKHADGKHYLLFGANVLDLNAYPDGAIILDPTLSEYSSTADGDLVYSDSDYPTAQGASVAESIYTSADDMNIGQSGVAGTETVYRSYCYFDTSSITTEVTITSASLFLYGKSDQSVTNFNIVVQDGQPTYPHNPLVTSDYDKDYYDPNGEGSSFGTVGFSTSGYNEIELNAAGRGMITKEGNTKLCIRSEEDIDASLPTSAEYVSVYSSDETGTSKDPYLYVEYTVPPTVETNACSDIASTSFMGNGEVTDDGGSTITRRGLIYVEGSTDEEDDFEWGSDGDPLSDDGGAIDWTIGGTSGSSYVQIDDDESYRGTRSAKFFRDGTNSPWARITHTMASDEMLSFWVMTDGGTYPNIYSGDGSTLLNFGVNSAENLVWYDGTTHDTGIDVPVMQWVLLEAKNIDWDADTYDLFYNGLFVAHCNMRVHTSWGNMIQFYTGSGTNNAFWIDDVSIGTMMPHSVEVLNPSFEVGSPPSDWTASRSTLARESTIKVSGYGSYSIKVTGTAVSGLAYAYQNIPDWESYKGETVTFGAWVYASSSNNQSTDLRIYDGVGTSNGADHPKDDAWHWLTVTRTIDAGATIVRVIDVARTTGTDADIAYFDGAILMHDDEILAIYEDDAFGEGIFDLTIDGLSSAADYRVRAFVQNDAGIGYGSIVEVTTLVADVSAAPVSINFSPVAAGSTPSTNTTYFTITNGGTIETDQYISVTGNWTGGTGWTHSDTATAGADTAGLLANRGGTWGVGDVIVKLNTPHNMIYEDCPAGTDYSFGLMLIAPTTLSDGVEKVNTVRITAVAS